MLSTREALLKRMAAIARMERGKLCAMRGGRYYNLQSWEGGQNVVRYIPAAEAPSVAKAVAGYARFMALAKRYADLVVQDTRKATSSARNEPRNGKTRTI